MYNAIKFNTFYFSEGYIERYYGTADPNSIYQSGQQVNLNRTYYRLNGENEWINVRNDGEIMQYIKIFQDSHSAEDIFNFIIKPKN